MTDCFYLVFPSISTFTERMTDKATPVVVRENSG